MTELLDGQVRYWYAAAESVPSVTNDTRPEPDPAVLSAVT
jgi:hypothetical protein